MTSLYVSLKTPTLHPSNLGRRRLNPEPEAAPAVVGISGWRAPRACLGVGVDAPSNATKSGVSKSKEVVEAEARVIVGTYARSPVVLVSGRDCKLYDVEGREYLDMSSGIAVNALGHGDKDWLKAVVDQAGTLTHVSNLYYSIPQVRKVSSFIYFILFLNFDFLVLVWEPGNLLIL